MVGINRFASDKNGQLLLVTGVVLAILLLILATINTDSANIIRIPTHQPDIGTGEMNDVVNGFSRALIYLSKEYASELPRKEAIAKAYDEISYQYNFLLSTRNIIFKASRGSIDSSSSVNRVDITITLVYQMEGVTSSLSQNLHMEIML